MTSGGGLGSDAGGEDPRLEFALPVALLLLAAILFSIALVLAVMDWP